MIHYTVHVTGGLKVRLALLHQLFGDNFRKNAEE